MHTKPEVLPVIEDMKARKRALDKLVADLREQLEEAKELLLQVDHGLSGLAATYDLPGVAILPPKIESGQFRNMTLANGAAAYLKLLNGEPAPTAVIWDALYRGGLVSGSRNPINNLGTTMSGKPEMFERTENGWVLVKVDGGEK